MTLETRKLLCQINSFYCGLALLYHLEFFKGRICIPVGSGARYNTLLMFFWRRWLKEYLPSLQERQKCLRPRRNFSVGDVILVVDENATRNAWPLGRIVEVKPNKEDRLVRRVAVKTRKTVLERPVDKIVLLQAFTSCHSALAIDSRLLSLYLIRELDWTLT